VIASVIVLQSLHGLSDREAADAVTFDLPWMAACGYPIDATGCRPSTLRYWRCRLAGSERPQRIFEAVRVVITATGVVAGRQRRALDSTVLDDAVARRDTVTQLIAVIGRVGREVPGARRVIPIEGTRLPALTGQDYASRGKPRIAWDDPDARDELVSARVGDALALLAGLDLEQIGAAGGKPADAVAVLAWWPGRTWNPPRTPTAPAAGGRSRAGPRRTDWSPPWTPTPGTPTRPGDRRQDGFKAHVVVEPDTGLTTAVRLTKTNGPENADATVGADLLTADTTITDST
jgi:hypothetical protein